MGRNLTATLIAAMQADVFEPLILVELEFDSGALYMWNGLGDYTTYGPELVPSGNFDVTVGPWTGSDATLSISSSALKILNGGTNGSARHSITTVIGKQYYVNWESRVGSLGSTLLNIGTTDGASDIYSSTANTSTSLVSANTTFTATSTTTYFSLVCVNDAATTPDAYYDNFSVRQVDGSTYTGAGNLLGLSNATETSEVVSRGMNVTLSGVPAALVALALDEPYQGRLCTVRWGYGGGGDTVILFSGVIDTMDIKYGGDTASISVSVENELSLLDRPVRWFYSDQSHKSRYPSDNFFSHVTEMQDAELQWGG